MPMKQKILQLPSSPRYQLATHPTMTGPRLMPPLLWPCCLP
jgi:hypothetical protein